MAKWKVKLEWYAFEHDFNKDELKRVNVLREEIKEAIKKGYLKGDWRLGDREKGVTKITSLNDLKIVLRGELMYYYWSKAEREVLVTGLFYKEGRDKQHKIDVWYQLEPNLDRIAEYVNNAMELELK